MDTRVLNTIYDAVEEINEQLPDGQRIPKRTDVVLFGKSGCLDSLGLVNFITEVEQRIEDEFDATLTLANEKALSQTRSPFHSIETLASYVTSLLVADRHE